MLCADVAGCISVEGELGYCCLSAIVASAHVSCLLSNFLSPKQKKKYKKKTPHHPAKERYIMRDLITYYPLDLIYFDL